MKTNRYEMDETTAKSIASINNQELANQIVADIYKLLIDKGLTFLQAEALLDYTKELLMNAKVCS